MSRVVLAGVNSTVVPRRVPVYDNLYFVLLVCFLSGRKGGAFKDQVQSSGARLHIHASSGEEMPHVATTVTRKKTQLSHTKVSLEEQPKRRER